MLVSIRIVVTLVIPVDLDVCSSLGHHIWRGCCADGGWCCGGGAAGAAATAAAVFAGVDGLALE